MRNNGTNVDSFAVIFLFQPSASAQDTHRNSPSGILNLKRPTGRWLPESPRFSRQFPRKDPTRSSKGSEVSRQLFPIVFAGACACSGFDLRALIFEFRNREIRVIVFFSFVSKGFIKPGRFFFECWFPVLIFCRRLVKPEWF